MLTIHAADLLIPGDRRPALPDGAVLVDGRELAAVGPYAELAAGHPTARVRRWPGLLTPGLLNPYGPELLERAYHPDPREADELGTEPLTGEALAVLAPTDTRWGASARRGVQRMLAHGTVAVAGELARPAVLDAVRRAGLLTMERPVPPAGAPSLDPLAGAGSLAEVGVAPLLPAGVATFAVFDVPDEATLLERGAATCVATVVAGRLVHRRR
ncbi:amidohydrolase family protein [Streptomyces sp. NPDC001443]